MRRRNLFSERLKREWAPTTFMVMMGLVLSFSTLAIAGYRFGTADQAQYLVQVTCIEQPRSLAGDPYASVFSSLGSMFWLLMAAISSESNRAIIVLLATLAIVFVNALLLARLMRVILGRGRPWNICMAAVCMLPSLLLVVPKERNWFGLVWLGDLELTATLAVMPLVFAVILLWTSGRNAWAWVSAAAAVLVQGQAGAALLSSLFFATLWSSRRNPRMLLLLGFAAAIGLLMIAIIRTTSWPAPDELAHYEDVGMAVNGPLLNPLVAPLRAWAGVFAVLGLGSAAALGLWRSGKFMHLSTDAGAAYTRLMQWCVASMVFPMLGLAALAAGLREPLLWKLMIGRWFMLPQLGAVVLFALWTANVLQSGRIPRVLTAAVLIAVTLWPFPIWSNTAAAVGLGMVMLIAALVRIEQPCTDQMQPRPFLVPRTFRSLGFAWPVVATTCLIAIMAMVALIHQPHPWLRRGESAAWLEAQQWARANTPEKARFVTPPYWSGWRVGSARRSFGEIKDGGLSFYAGRSLLLWARRMELLGMASTHCWIESATLCGVVRGRTLAVFREESAVAYRDALQQRLACICREEPVDFIVAEQVADAGIGELVWSNSDFVIRRLDPEWFATLDRNDRALDVPHAAQLASLDFDAANDVQ